MTKTKKPSSSKTAKTTEKKALVKSTAGKDKKKSVPRTVRANLSVPIPRIGQVARMNWPAHVGADAEVILAAAADAIMTKILSDAAKNAGKHTIMPNDIEWAIRNNRWVKRFIPGHVGSVFIK